MKVENRIYRHGLAALLIVGPFSVATAEYFPDDGDLCYDGAFTADSFFAFDSAGPFSFSDSGYEHDFVISDQFFTSCTSITNLPAGYDDCGTAGISEPSSGLNSYSFGSYDGDLIQSDVFYYGQWSFAGGDTVVSNVILNGQEVRHSICPLDNPFCMGGVQSHQLATGVATFGGVPSCLTF
jgi:hypothetical protein